MIPSTSLSVRVKIQIMGRKVGLRCKGKNTVGHCQQIFFDKKFVDNSKQCFADKNKNKKFKRSQLLEGDWIGFRLPFKIFSTLKRRCKNTWILVHCDIVGFMMIWYQGCYLENMLISVNKCSTSKEHKYEQQSLD